MVCEIINITQNDKRNVEILSKSFNAEIRQIISFLSSNFKLKSSLSKRFVVSELT